MYLNHHDFFDSNYRNIQCNYNISNNLLESFSICLCFFQSFISNKDGAVFSVNSGLNLNISLIKLIFYN